MKILSLALAIALILAYTPIAYCQDDYKDGSDSSDEGSTSTNAMTGGILKRNYDAPYRIIPKNDEEDARAIDTGVTSKKASDKTGQDPIAGGTGTGALARALMSTDQQRREQKQEQAQEQAQEQEIQDYQRVPKNVPLTTGRKNKVKRRVKREYDDEGNLIEEGK